ncbi:MAG: hypothetical protein U0X20_22490 [Caldilineaceae bacterium]
MYANRLLCLCVAAIVALLALAPATTALAVPPTQTTVYVDDTFEDPSLTAKCGFSVQIHLDGPLKLITRYDRAGILGRQLRLVLTRQLMDAAAQTTAVKLQWRPLVQGLGTWLADSASMPFAPAGEDVTPLRPRYGLRSTWQLDDLTGDILSYDPRIRSMRVFTLISDPERIKQRQAAAAQLIDYIAGAYGIDVLPKLLQGFAQYDDWEQLAPAVLGISAAELEEGWHTAMREAAPLRTFH